MDPAYANPTIYTPWAIRLKGDIFPKLITLMGTRLRLSATILLDLTNKVVFLGFSYVAALAATTLVFQLNRVLRNSPQG